MPGALVARGKCRRSLVGMRLPALRADERQRESPQLETVRIMIVSPIAGIAHERMADAVEMPPDLVSAPRLDPDFDMGLVCPGIMVDYAITRDGRLAIQGGGNRRQPVRSFKAAFQDGVIPLGYPATAKQTGEAAGRTAVMGDQDQALRLPVQPVDGPNPPLWVEGFLGGAQQAAVIAEMRSLGEHASGFIPHAVAAVVVDALRLGRLAVKDGGVIVQFDPVAAHGPGGGTPHAASSSPLAFDPHRALGHGLFDPGFGEAGPACQIAA